MRHNGLSIRLAIKRSMFQLPITARLCNDSGQVVHALVTIIKQHNLVHINQQWRSAAGKVTVGLVLHWPCHFSGPTSELKTYEREMSSCICSNGAWHLCYFITITYHTCLWLTLPWQMHKYQHCSVLFLSLLDPRVGHTMDVLSPFISILCHSDTNTVYQQMIHIPVQTWQSVQECDNYQTSICKSGKHNNFEMYDDTNKLSVERLESSGSSIDPFSSLVRFKEHLHQTCIHCGHTRWVPAPVQSHHHLYDTALYLGKLHFIINSYYHYLAANHHLLCYILKQVC